MEAVIAAPDTIFWHGLRIRSVEPRPGEKQRWETKSFSAGERCWVSLNEAGQYMAAFTDGVVGINYDYGKALYEACKKAHDFKLLDAALLADRLGLFR